MLFKETAALVLLVMLSAFALIPVAASADTLTADFIAHDSFTHGFAPFTAQFEDRSTAEFSRVWSFGDGQTSTESNPSHTYTNPGSYTVSITVYDSTGTQSNTKTVADYIVVAEDPMHAATTTTPVPGATTGSPTSTTTTVPSTTATPAMSGAIAVTSLPAGAMVTLDNVQQGITPITLYTVAVGQHTVIVHDKGYVDNVTKIVVEYQKTTDLPVVLVKTAVGTTTPTPSLSPSSTVTETPAPEAQKAAAVGEPTKSDSERIRGRGKIQISCPGCMNLPASNSHIVLYAIEYTNNFEIWRLKNESEETTVYAPPGEYQVRVQPDNYHDQVQQVVVKLGSTSNVEFKGNTFVKSPGFSPLLAVLAFAGILGLRRCKK